VQYQLPVPGGLFPTAAAGSAAATLPQCAPVSATLVLGYH
jgi:hypothetical protein